MEAKTGVCVFVADEFEKFGIIVVTDIVFIARPDGLNGVDFVAVEVDVEWDEV